MTPELADIIINGFYCITFLVVAHTAYRSVKAYSKNEAEELRKEIEQLHLQTLSIEENRKLIRSLQNDMNSMKMSRGWSGD